MNFSLRGTSSLCPLLDIALLLAFAILLCFVAHKMQQRNMIRGI